MYSDEYQDLGCFCNHNVSVNTLLTPMRLTRNKKKKALV